MTRPVVGVRPDMVAEDAARLLVKHSFTMLPVMAGSGRRGGCRALPAPLEADAHPEAFGRVGQSGTVL
ncbi:CBS domain-containing protein [Actinosynnema sp. NPDC023794]